MLLCSALLSNCAKGQGALFAHVCTLRLTVRLCLSFNCWVKPSAAAHHVCVDGSSMRKLPSCAGSATGVERPLDNDIQRYVCSLARQFHCLSSQVDSLQTRCFSIGFRARAPATGAASVAGGKVHSYASLPACVRQFCADPPPLQPTIVAYQLAHPFTRAQIHLLSGEVGEKRRVYVFIANTQTSRSEETAYHAASHCAVPLCTTRFNALAATCLPESPSAKATLYSAGPIHSGDVDNTIPQSMQAPLRTHLIVLQPPRGAIRLRLPGPSNLLGDNDKRGAVAGATIHAKL